VEAVRSFWRPFYLASNTKRFVRFSRNSVLKLSIKFFEQSEFLEDEIRYSRTLFSG
jgi:hypothetical protein